MNRCMLTIKIAAFIVAGLLLIVSFRYLHALQVVNSYSQTDYDLDLDDLGYTESLRILPLFEAWARTSDYKSGHGVAYLLETDRTTLLFDLGNNELSEDQSPLAHNMEQHGISLDDLDYIAISHNHPDHVGGMRWWRNGTFSVDGKQGRLNGKNVYLPVELSYPDLEPIIVTEPLVIAPGLATLGRLPFIQPFPIWIWEPLGWEQSLAVNIEGVGIIIISGCGHPGLEKILTEAEKLIDLPVKGVVGGLHYLNSTEDEISSQIEFLREREPRLVALSPHDSIGSVLQQFEQAFPQAYRYISIGLDIAVTP
jgi:7,8-dihydropterin-6-yl-methyl-4-(beta-D-ribofuranosyl)aminobenzene 5'-phosphate synthase